MNKLFISLGSLLLFFACLSDGCMGTVFSRCVPMARAEETVRPSVILQTLTRARNCTQNGKDCTRRYPLFLLPGGEFAELAPRIWTAVQAPLAVPGSPSLEEKKKKKKRMDRL